MKENGNRVRRGLALLAILAAWAPGQVSAIEAEHIVGEMQSAYSRVRDYQVRVTSTVREHGGASEETRLLYRFQRPNRVRIEFLEPHPGMVLVYPTASGKVLVQFGGLLQFLRISLDPESARLRVAPGQRIDQTDLGLLVQNISRSLTDPHSDELAIRTTPEFVVVDVEAENHFQPALRTHYQFWIDRLSWLPARLHEEVPAREWERDVSFTELETNLGLSADLFRLE